MTKKIFPTGHHGVSYFRVMINSRRFWLEYHKAKDFPQYIVEATEEEKKVLKTRKDL